MEQELDSSYPLFFTDFAYAYNVLTQVIPYLDIVDIVACSRVCDAWMSVIAQDRIWTKYKLKCCGRHIKHIPNGLENFVQEIELREVAWSSVNQCAKLLTRAKNVTKLVLCEVQLNIFEQVTPIWLNLEKLRVNQISWDQTANIPEELKLHQYASNLSSLSLEVNYKIWLQNLNSLQQLRHLFVDANFSRGFFGPEHRFLRNLDSFGVGYSNYKSNPSNISLYNEKLSKLLKNQLKSITKLKLGYLEKDFLILAAVSKHPNLEELSLSLVNSWNNYSFFLGMCSNIKRLAVTMIWPQERISSISEIAAQNSILIGSIKNLANTLTHFTWDFEIGYMTESEVEIAIDNDKWRLRYTVIWENIVDFRPERMSYKDVRIASKSMFPADLSLDELKGLLSKQLPNVEVVVKTDKYNGRCNYCAEDSPADVSMHLLKILRIDRQRARWLQGRRIQHLPARRIVH